MADESPPFWQTTPLEEMTSTQWESLCDGCGLCCLHRFEDEDTGQIVTSEVACHMLDLGSCKCKDYPNRLEVVPGCAELAPDTARLWTWLPQTCGYRLIARGEPLAWWHPLVSGSSETVHEAGISVKGFAVSENAVILEAIQAALTEQEG